MEEEVEPEEIFQMCTIMPRLKMKVTAHLEDPEGNVTTIKEVAKGLVEFIDNQMTTQEANPINSQLFPACGQFMTSLVPRFVGMNVAALLFQAPSFRDGMLFLSLGSVLLTQYIDQHKLKIVTSQEELTEEQVEEYLSRSVQAEQSIRNALSDLLEGEEEL